MQLCTLLLFPFLKTGTLPITWYNTIVKTYETVGTVDTHDDRQMGGNLFPDGINPLMECDASLARVAVMRVMMSTSAGCGLTGTYACFLSTSPSSQYWPTLTS